MYLAADFFFSWAWRKKITGYTSHSWEIRKKNPKKPKCDGAVSIWKWESLASEKGQKKNAYKEDQVRQEIFHEILKRHFLRLLLWGNVRRKPPHSCSGDRPAKWRWTYPYHEDRFPDVTHAVVDQTRCINELVLLEGLRGVCAQCLDRDFHLFGKAGHHCKLRRKESRQWEIWRSWCFGVEHFLLPHMAATLRWHFAVTIEKMKQD